MVGFRQSRVAVVECKCVQVGARAREVQWEEGCETAAGELECCEGWAA